MYMDIFQQYIFDQILKQLFLTLISKRKDHRRFENVYEKMEFQILPEKYHLSVKRHV